MAQIIDVVNHTAGIDSPYAAPVGKKIYGFVGIRSLDISADVDGANVVILSNGGERQYYLPCPIEFKASTVLKFVGASTNTVGIIRDE